MADEVEAGMEAAQAAFSAGLSGQAPGGAPAVAAPAVPAPEATPAAPAAEPASTPAAIPAAEPAVAAAPAPAAPQVPINVQDPAAKRFLDMYGGDPEKALAAALDHNNRLAALARANPELFRPGGPADPKAAGQDAPFTQPAIPAEIPPPVEVDPSQVYRAAQDAANQDGTTRNLLEAYVQRDERSRFLGAEISKLERGVSYLNDKLKDPDFGGDELKAADIKSQIRDARGDLLIARQELSIIDSEKTNLDGRYRQRFHEIHNHVAQSYQQQANEQALVQAEEQIRTESYQSLSVAWPAGLDRAIQAHNIPADQAPKFKAQAKLEAQARIGSDPNFTIDNVDGFVAPIAKRFVEDLDAYHRARSAQYAAQATTRATTGAAAPTSAPAGTPVSTAAAETDPDALFEQANRGFKSRIRSLVGR